MLTARVLRVGGHAYYLEELDGTGTADGARTGRRPADGRWAGTGAASLGLSGEVAPEAFAALLRGAHPGTGASLGPRRGVEVGAYDLTFAAPKSVSLLALVGPRELAAAAGDAHRAAVADATGYVERAALRARRSHGGHVTLLATGGLVAGAFGHRTSRALDPHLHTHLVVANVVHASDGRWTAVDSRRVFAHLRAAGLAYQASLRAELTARAGVAWEVSERGFGDVVGVPVPLRRLFSQRSAAISRHLEGVGERGRARPPGPPRASRRGAFYATRPGKKGDRGADQLADEWRARAADCGFDLSVLARVVGRARTGERRGAGEDAGRATAHLASLDPDRPLARRDVVAALAASATAGARVAQLERAADGLLAGCGRGRRDWRAEERAHEPRWPAGVVADAAARSGLVLDSGPDSGRDSGRAASGWGSPWDERVRDRARQPGIGLGR